ncbi:MAG: hypothetical protein KAT65_15130 [Methanophagales archaeon]|nr:hypothetical protein [Methanophagales archaeon]
MDNKKLLYLVLALCVPLLVVGATALSESPVLTETPNTTISAPPEVYTPQFFEAHRQYMASINFTWLGNESLNETLEKGNVGGGDVNVFKAALEQDGFIVQQGTLKTIPIFDLVNERVLFSCNGNNPSAPYKAYILPPAPNQSVPNPFADKTNMSIAYRLRPDEALVLIGKTPPNCTYFSYQSFQFYHFYPIEEAFRKIFANVGDTLNHLTINPEGTSEREPFGCATIIVTSADRGTDQRVRAAAVSAGYSPAIMNTEVLPSSIFRMGIEMECDPFVFLHRIAFFTDAQAGNAYMNSNPGVVFRITPKAQAERDPYKVQELRVRGTGNTSEFELMGALNDLRQALLERFGADNATELVTSVWLTEGYDAIQRGVDVLGVTRDTTYLNTTPFTLADDPNEFLIVYGVNHVATGKAIYSSFGVYGTTLANGVAAVDNQQFASTAEEYIPGHPAANYLYVWKVARQCNGDPHCLKVPSTPGAYGVGLDEQAFVAFRAYVDPPTKVGPAYSEIVYDRVIKFGIP